MLTRLLTITASLALCAGLCAGCNKSSSNRGIASVNSANTGQPNSSSNTRAGFNSATDDHGDTGGYASTFNLGLTELGLIEDSGDDDWFIFVASGPQGGTRTYRFTITADNNIAADLNGGISNSGKDIVLSFSPQNAGPNYLKINAAPNTTTAFYSILVEEVITPSIPVITTADKVITRRTSHFERQLGTNNTLVVDTLPHQAFDSFEITSAANGETLYLESLYVTTTTGITFMQGLIYDVFNNSSNQSTPIAAPSGTVSGWRILDGSGVNPLVSLVNRGDRANVTLFTDGTNLDGQDHQITLDQLEVRLDNGPVETISAGQTTVNLQFREFNRIQINPWPPLQSVNTVRGANTTIADYCLFNSSTAHVNSLTSVTVNVVNPPAGITNYRLQTGGTQIPVNSVAGGPNLHQITFLLGPNAVQVNPNSPPGGAAAAIFQILADTTGCNTGDVVRVVSQWGVADSASGAMDTPIHQILDPNTGQSAEFNITLQ